MIDCPDFHVPTCIEQAESKTEIKELVRDLFIVNHFEILPDNSKTGFKTKEVLFGSHGESGAAKFLPNAWSQRVIWDPREIRIYIKYGNEGMFSNINLAHIPVHSSFQDTGHE